MGIQDKEGERREREKEGGERACVHVCVHERHRVNREVLEGQKKVAMLSGVLDIECEVYNLGKLGQEHTELLSLRSCHQFDLQKRFVEIRDVSLSLGCALKEGLAAGNQKNLSMRNSNQTTISVRHPNVVKHSYEPRKLFILLSDDGLTF